VKPRASCLHTCLCHRAV